MRLPVGKMEAAVNDSSTVDSAGVVPAPKKRRKRKLKRDELRAVEGLSQREAVRQQVVPRWTLNDWRRAKDSVTSYPRSENRVSRGPGRRGIIPFGGELVTFMKDTRRDCEVLTAKVMAGFVPDVYPEWLGFYTEAK